MEIKIENVQASYVGHITDLYERWNELTGRNDDFQYSGEDGFGENSYAYRSFEPVTLEKALTRPVWMKPEHNILIDYHTVVGYLVHIEELPKTKLIIDMGW